MTPAIAPKRSSWNAIRNPVAEPFGLRKIVSPDGRDGSITRSNTAGPFCLIGNGVVSIAAVPGLVVRVRDGSLWITQTGDSADHVVRAGERFVAERAGRLVVSAFGHSEVELQWPTREQERPRAAYAPVAAAA